MALGAFLTELECCGSRIWVMQEFLPGVPPLLSTPSASRKRSSEVGVVLL